MAGEPAPQRDTRHGLHNTGDDVNTLPGIIARVTQTERDIASLKADQTELKEAIIGGIHNGVPFDGMRQHLLDARREIGAVADKQSALEEKIDGAFDTLKAWGWRALKIIMRGIWALAGVGVLHLLTLWWARIAAVLPHINPASATTLHP